MKYVKKIEKIDLLPLLLFWSCVGCIPGFIDSPPPSDSAEIFLETVEKNYVYLYEKDINIEAERNKYASDAGSVQFFDALIRSFVARFEEVQFQILKPYAFRYGSDKELNYDLSSVYQNVAYLSEYGNFAYARIRDYTKVGYLLITSFEGIREFVNSSDFQDRIISDMKSDDTKALVIDIRPCSTGAVEDIDVLLEHFMDQERAYFKYRLRNGGKPKDFTSWREIHALPTQSPWDQNIPIIILIGDRTHFAAEWFAAALKTAPYVTLVGDTTSGQVSLTRYFEMPNGYVYKMPTWDIRDMQDTKLEGRGIAPLLLVEEWKKKDGRDSVISTAISYLVQRYGIKEDF